MNPPFGTRWGLYPGEVMSRGKFKKSEHLFLELAIRALKPGGKALVIAPYNLVDKLPQAGMKWFDQNVAWWKKSDVLPGEFAFTQIKVHAYVLERALVAAPAKIVMPAMPDLSKLPQNQLQMTLF